MNDKAVRKNPIPQALIDAVANPDLSDYKACHNMRGPVTKGGHPMLRYTMDGEAYSTAIHDVHRSRVYIRGKKHEARAFTNGNGYIELRQASQMGNYDDAKLFAGERKFGNMYITFEPVAGLGRCPMLSPGRSVSERADFSRELAKLDESRLCMDPQDHHFPEDKWELGEDGRPYAGMNYPGPHRSHVPGHKESIPNEQCEFGTEQWVSMTYEKPLFLLAPDSTPGFKDEPLLCMRVMESDGSLFDVDAAIQAPVAVNALKQLGEITFAVNVDNPSILLMRPGRAGRQLAEISTLSVTLGYVAPTSHK